MDLPFKQVPLAAYRPELEEAGRGLRGYRPAPAGWKSGLTRPPMPGVYMRLTELCVSRDFWDGEFWRRQGAINGYSKFAHRGIICANQYWPWAHLGEFRTKVLRYSTRYAPTELTEELFGGART